jgi:phosphocarrier protein HPr
MSEPGDFEQDRSDDRSLGVGEPVVQVVEIVNKKGLHARASAKFVKLAEEFDAQVRVTRSGETVGGTSIMGLMMLAASPGTRITIEGTGTEAAAAVSALSRLVRDRFGEED